MVGALETLGGVVVLIVAALALIVLALGIAGKLDERRIKRMVEKRWRKR